MENHLIIGLGGTGGNILKALRKNIYQDYRDNLPKGVNVGYLYVDSSAEMMDPSDAKWKVLSHSVQLGKSSQVLIKGQNLKARLSNLESYPGLKHWLSNDASFKELVESNADDAVASQRRRLGRFLFACSIDSFNIQLEQQVGTLRKSGTADITFHVCAGLAGGTGSGCVVDVISQIRSKFPPAGEGREFRIILYLAIPDREPNYSSIDYYHANGYASLLELNSLNVRGFTPFDITGKSGDTTGVTVDGRLKLELPVFNGCYVFTNENTNGTFLDRERTFPNMIAEFLKQKIVTFHFLTDGTKSHKGNDTGNPDARTILSKQENAENGKKTPEMGSSPETAHTPERDKRFLSFGIKTISIPEKEILEYLTAEMAKAALNQLKFQNFQAGVGYLNSQGPSDYKTKVTSKIDAWKISLDHLTYSKNLLEEDGKEKYQIIENYWEQFAQNAVNLKNSSPKPEWPRVVMQAYRGAFDTLYRKSGVKGFYMNKQSSCRRIAEDLLNHVELDLVNMWRNGELGFVDLEGILRALKDELLKSKATLEAQSTDLVEGFKRQKEIVNAAVGRFSNNLGIVDKARSLPERNIELLNADLKKLYILETKVESLPFALQLIGDLSNKVNQLINVLAELSSRIGKLIERSVTNSSSRLLESDIAENATFEVRIFDKQLVKDIASDFVKDIEILSPFTSDVRQSLLGVLTAGQLTFSAMAEKLDESNIEDIVNKCSQNKVESAHERLEPRRKVLGRSIIQELAAKYGGDEEGFKLKINDWIKQAGVYARNDDSELKINDSISSITECTVVYPDEPDHKDFVDRMAGLFNASKPQTLNRITLAKHSNREKKNELVILTVTNLMPLRYLADVKFLRDKYDGRVNHKDLNTRAESRMLLHLEGDGSQHPPLYITTKKKEDYWPDVILAEALGIFTNAEASSGKVEYLFHQKDEDGLDLAPIELGVLFTKIVEKATMESLGTIKMVVAEHLTGEYKSEAKREAIREKVLAKKSAEDVLLAIPKTDPFYIAYTEATRGALQLLKS